MSCLTARAASAARSACRSVVNASAYTVEKTRYQMYQICRRRYGDCIINVCILRRWRHAIMRYHQSNNVTPQVSIGASNAQLERHISSAQCQGARRLGPLFLICNKWPKYHDIAGCRLVTNRSRALIALIVVGRREALVFQQPRPKCGARGGISAAQMPRRLGDIGARWPSLRAQTMPAGPACKRALSSCHAGEINGPRAPAVIARRAVENGSACY